MLVSYKWLQSYFKEPLPQPSELVDLLTMRIFEVEGAEEKQGDIVLDVKTLPDRNPYCLSHRYIAQEIGAIVRKEVNFPKIDKVTLTDVSSKLNIKIDNSELCPRYMGRVVENIEIKNSPDWLKSQLEVLGQRSINNIVDLTNYVMLETGQPLHAFDADKVVGDIHVRFAAEGEEIVILDGSTVKLQSTMLVVADNDGPIAIAGVKGGKRAEISSTTRVIIIEAANFSGPSVRRTSQQTNIRNDSSKRFENRVTPERAELAMGMISDLFSKDVPSAKFGEVVDVYPVENKIGSLEVSIKELVAKLGTEIPSEEIINILKWCKIGVEKKSEDLLALTIPEYRPDLKIFEDITDEVGRLFGYENVPVRIPQNDLSQPINKNFYYINFIKKILIDKGFSEILTYTLNDKGDMVLENPLNLERGKLRNDLSTAMVEKLEFNIRNLDLLGQPSVRVFEIGKVFGEKREHWSLAIGIAQPKSTKGDSVNEQIRNIREHLIGELGANIQTVCTVDDTGGIVVLNNKPIGEINKIDGVMEVDLEKIIEVLPDPASDAAIDLPPLTQNKFSKISPYPFMVRDIAVFVPGEAGQEEQVLNIIKKHGTNLLIRTSLFDTFTKKKEGEPTKTSYAYRMVYQANDRTLVDEEVNSIMQKITDEMNTNEGWQVR